MINISNDSFKTLKKPNKLISISLFITIIINLATYLTLDFLDLKTRIIIMLSVVCIALIVDVITLYVQYYIYYYQIEYLNKVYNLINENLERLDKNLSTMEQQAINLKQDISKNNEAIKLLQSKIV